jgi:FKBP-type peptidyl-prolyl cis-trans isomerase
MMNNWKDLLVLSALWSGFSLYALGEPVGQVPTLPSKDAPLALPTAIGSKSVVDQKTQQNRYLQTLGQIIVRNAGLANFGLDTQEIEQVINGMKAALNGERIPTTTPEEMENMQQFFEQKEKDQIANTKKLGEVFLKTKQAEPNVQKTASGLLYKIVKPGDNMRANEDCSVEIDYEGKLINGEVFDSTYERKEKASLYLGMLIPGFSEAIKLVGQGGELQAFIPSDLAYGDENVGPILGGSVLDFSIKVYKIIQPTLEKEEPNGKEEPKKEELK